MVRVLMRVGPVALSAAVAATVFLLFAASSVLPELVEVARVVRWVGVVGLCAIALGLVTSLRAWHLVPAIPVALVAAFAALAVVSAAWSIHPFLTFKRASTFVVLVVAAIGFAAAARRDRRIEHALLLGLLGGAVAVALAGLVVYAFDPEVAVQGGGDDNPSRWKGLGLSPNTASTLFALSAPISVWYTIAARGTAARAGAGIVSLLLLGSIFASGSRGGTIASFVGVAFVILTLRSSVVARAALLAAAAAVYGVGVATFETRGIISELTREAPPPATPSPGGAGPAAPEPPVEARELPNVVSHAGWDVYRAGVSRFPELPPRGFFGAADGRMVVWHDAINQGLERPLTGFGFGNEELVFVNRSLEFNGNRPENSFIGVFMQLGLIGLAVFLAMLAALVAPFLRRRPPTPVAAAAGCMVAGVAMCTFQSYVYSVGSVAAATFWLAALLTATAATRRLPSFEAQDGAGGEAVTLAGARRRHHGAQGPYAVR